MWRSKSLPSCCKKHLHCILEIYAVLIFSFCLNTVQVLIFMSYESAIDQEAILQSPQGTVSKIFPYPNYKDIL